MSFSVFITRRLTPEAEEKLNAFCQAEYWPEETPPPYPVLREKTRHADGLICMLTDQIDSELINNSERLKAISQVAVGVDNIDLEAASLRGVPVGHTPDLLTEATADLSFALILAAARKIPEAVDYARSGQWKTWGLTTLLGESVYGATLGIIGMGRIGQAVARRAQGFSMPIIYTANRPRPEIDIEFGATQVTLNHLLHDADIISLHVPLNESTHGLIGSEQFAMMKPNAILVNAARGAVVDTDALVTALITGQIGYAALDVTDPEPLPASHTLYQLSNAIVVPHIGSATRKARNKMSILAVDNLMAGLLGKNLPKAANKI